MKTQVVRLDARYNRTAYLTLDNDKVIFDCSDEEYGPIEFPLQLLVDKLKFHTNRLREISNDLENE